MNLRYVHSFWIQCLFLTAFFQAGAGFLQAQGSIQFLNTIFSRIKYLECRAYTNSVYTDAPAGTRMSVEVGSDPFHLTEAGPPVAISSNGLFNGGAAYPVSGMEGQTVWMRVVGTIPSTGVRGESEVLPIKLGPFMGPGTVIFQSETGLATNRFRSFVIRPPGICYEDSIIGAYPLRQVVFTQPTSDVFATSRVNAAIAPELTQVRIDFTTIDGSARASVDYVATNGTVILPRPPAAAQPASQDVAIRILPSPFPKAPRYFFLRYTNAFPTPQVTMTRIQWLADPYITAIRREPLSTQISIPIVPGWNYILESSTDLINWEPVPGALNDSGTDVRTIFDMRPNCCGNRFYRMRAE